MNSYIGQLLDNRYELLEVIGTGGMAVVYKALCHRLNRLVAVKILKDEFSGDEEFRRRFRAEGEAVAMLSHPNIVQVFDVSSTDNANFIVMELIDGISLKQYMEVKGVLNWKETLHFATQIAKGLEHAHSRGIVHRDIKPHNVMVLKNGSVKVMDFGIAQVMNKSSTLTKEALGSVHYISPEQAKGSYTDNRSDIYSLGVVMYEMMAGRPPYDGDSPVAVAIQHINGGAKAPSLYNPNIPSGLEQIIMHCMALDARDRYPDAGALLQDLEEFRKNPAIAFQYHSIVDDATRPVTGIPMKPRNTAEKIAKAKGGVTSNIAGAASGKAGSTGKVHLPGNKQNSGAVTARDAEAVRRAQQRRREEERREAERSRVATIAVVACSAVAVIAIVVFLVAIFNGAILSRDKDLVDVPYLVGDMYSEEFAARYPDFNIRLQPQQYDKYYAKGQIMSQEPEGGNKVEKGTVLYITVSMGEEPQVKVMEDMVGVTQDRATSFLSGQGFKTLIREEASDEFPVGLIIRTEPEKDTELVDGQTIKLWVSTGPKKCVMPNVVGMDYVTALKVLEQEGFTNVLTYDVDSEQSVGQVVKQSQPWQTEIVAATQIILEVSKGPVETTAPTTEPPTEPATTPTTEPTTEPTTSTWETTPPPAPNQISARVTFKIPAREEGYELKILRDGDEVVSTSSVQAGQDSFVAVLSGSGTVEYDLYINGEYFQTQKVKFSDG